jgi:hypothetical protein
MLPQMKKNSDGLLTLYIQKDSPGADKEVNWLPALTPDLSRASFRAIHRRHAAGVEPTSASQL